MSDRNCSGGFVVYWTVALILLYAVWDHGLVDVYKAKGWDGVRAFVKGEK